jgi:hypothetical protein
LKNSQDKKKVFVLVYDGDIEGVFDNKHEAELAAYQSKSPEFEPWRIEETTYYFTKENK